jgi:Raf kinase inhibitor-like YbhB/YbcL family protein
MLRRIALWMCLAGVPLAALAQGFVLTSPALPANGAFPLAAVYTQCGGSNQSPALRWVNPPAGTRSYAVTMFDTDAAGGFWHWIAFNIAVGAHGLNPDAGVPHSGNAPGDTVQLRNDFGDVGYSGPCPPAGRPHHYVITVYALDVPTLGIAARFSRKDALAAIDRHTLAKAMLTATWGR